MSAPRPTALITGASGGIGLELAREFARGGYDLVLVARGADKLQALADNLRATHGIAAHVIAADLLAADAVPQLMAALAGRDLSVEVLVNNAGFGLHGAFLATDAQRERDMIRLNIGVLTELSKACAPAMVARRHGGILNIASTASFVPGAGMAVYYATKAYVLSFSEALHEELKPHGVTVTALCPGPTHTGFQADSGVGVSNLVQKGHMMEAATVARIGYAAFRRGDAVKIAGLWNELQIQSTRLSPRALTRRLVAGMNAPAVS